MESLRDKNRKPTHGGAILREDIPSSHYLVCHV